MTDEKVFHPEALDDACSDLWWRGTGDNVVIFDPKILKNKRIVVNWSGGWDSTALLIVLAFRYGCPNVPIIAHVTKSGNINSAQQEKEQEMIAVLKDVLVKEFKLPIEFYESTIDVGGYALGLRYFGISQAVLNAFSSFMYHTGDNTVVCYGYVYKDDFWVIKDDFLKCIYHYGRMLGNPSAEVAFPLNSATKKDIMNFLKKLGLLEYTWYCERPEDGKPCGECGSCERVKELLRDDLKEEPECVEQSNL